MFALRNKISNHTTSIIKNLLYDTVQSGTDNDAWSIVVNVLYFEIWRYACFMVGGIRG